MQLKKIGSLLAALALVTLGATAQAAPQTAPNAATIKTAAPHTVVIVKLGPAMQEEYIGGEPAERTTTYLTGETAQKPAANAVKTKPQG